MLTEKDALLVNASVTCNVTEIFRRHFLLHQILIHANTEIHHHTLKVVNKKIEPLVWSCVRAETLRKQITKKNKTKCVTFIRWAFPKHHWRPLSCKPSANPYTHLLTVTLKSSVASETTVWIKGVAISSNTNPDLSHAKTLWRSFIMLWLAKRDKKKKKTTKLKKICTFRNIHTPNWYKKRFGFWPRLILTIRVKQVQVINTGELTRLEFITKTITMPSSLPFNALLYKRKQKLHRRKKRQ